MALSDCPKCWETPCMCGHEYEDWSHDAKVKLINAVLSRFTKDENDKTIMGGKNGKLHFTIKE